jgi:hypothetical protein
MAKTPQERDPAAYTPSDNEELYTPRLYIDAVRAVMGGIDLDPASNVQANGIVQATYYYTGEEGSNGLLLPWELPSGRPARVFNNFPYGKFEDGEGKTRFNSVAWTSRFVSEFDNGHMKEGIILANAQSGAKWFHKMLARFPVCLTDHRIKFIDGATMLPLEQPRWYSAFFYAGPGKKLKLFHEHFSPFGTVMVDCQRMIFT